MFTKTLWPWRSRLARRCAVVAVAVMAGVLVPSSVASAAAIPNPPADGSAPGAELVGTVLGWLKWAGLASALAGLLIGAITTGIGHFGSNYSASSAGKKWILGGIGAAMIAGLAHAITTTVYAAT